MMSKYIVLMLCAGFSMMYSMEEASCAAEESVPVEQTPARSLSISINGLAGPVCTVEATTNDTVKLLNEKISTQLEFPPNVLFTLLNGTEKLADEMLIGALVEEEQHTLSLTLIKEKATILAERFRIIKEKLATIGMFLYPDEDITDDLLGLIDSIELQQQPPKYTHRGNAGKFGMGCQIDIGSLSKAERIAVMPHIVKLFEEIYEMRTRVYDRALHQRLEEELHQIELQDYERATEFYTHNMSNDFKVQWPLYDLDFKMHKTEDARTVSVSFWESHELHTKIKLHLLAEFYPEIARILSDIAPRAEP